jgi:Ribbon-helix-helix protein, copG family
MNMKKSPFQVYLDARDGSLLERLAKRLGLSKAETLREALRRWAVELDAPHDPLIGLIGSFDDQAAPTDLSTRHDEYAVRGYPGRGVAEPRRGRGSRG